MAEANCCGNVGMLSLARRDADRQLSARYSSGRTGSFALMDAVQMSSTVSPKPPFTTGGKMARLGGKRSVCFCAAGEKSGRSADGVNWQMPGRSVRNKYSR